MFALRCLRQAGYYVVVSFLYTTAVYLPTHAQLAGPAASAEVINFLLKSGAEALMRERYSEAISYCTEILRLDWNHPRAYDLLQEIRLERAHTLLRWEADARAAERQSDWVGARTIYERILAEDTSRHDLQGRVAGFGRQNEVGDFIHSGMEKFMADDFASALLDFESALAIDPNDTKAAQFRDRTKQKIAASGSLAAIQTSPESWGKHLEALQQLREGNLTAAERLWNDLLVLYPGNESLRSNLEQVRRRLSPESSQAEE